MFEVKYQLANTAGYKFNIVKIGHNEYDSLAYYHKENFPDIEITRPNIDTDLSLLNTKCLLTVNGYIYPTIYQNNRLFIPNATKTMLKSRSNNIGILSFNNLTSNLIKHNITIDMITAETHFSLYEKAIITFPNDIGNAILVIAGYPIFQNPEYFYRVSGNSFVLRLDRLQYIEKLYELERYRDIFKELNITVSPNNPSMIDGIVVRSDAIIMKFLTLFNSFLVEVPSSTLTTSKIYLEHSNVSGNFRTEKEPIYPIVAGYGKFCEYTKRKNNDTKYTVYMNDAYYNQHLISNMSYNDIKVYNDHRQVGSTYRLSNVFFLNIQY